MNRHVAALDRMLARDGEPIVLRRPTTVNSVTTYQDVTVQASARGYAPQELVGGIQ